jgi:HD-GYP domain-containing protein (c-di-GMP phosphodiesterase class II)
LRRILGPRKRREYKSPQSMAGSDNPQEGIRRAEVVAALSLATDLAIGQPLEFALKSCALGMRVAAALRLDPATTRQVYDHAQLRYIGCNAETDAMAALLGDEIEFRRLIATLDMGDPAEFAPVLLRAIVQAQAGQSLPSMVWGVLKGLAISKSVTVNGFRAHCETAERLARRLGFEGATLHNLGQFQERWDGKGLPGGLKAEAISPAVRVVTLAQDFIVLHETQGLAAAVAAVKRRRGKLYEPRVADLFVSSASELMKGLSTQSSWDAVLALEPAPQARLSEAQLDEACLAMADFADIKSPFTLGHSRAVAILAAEAGRRCGLPAKDVTALRRAGLLHDLGQVAVSSGIFAKPSALNHSEWEKVRLHPYHGERILSRAGPLVRLADILSRHHERIDGSGYHRGTNGDGISPLAKILAAAEIYRAMIEARPHRSAFAPDQAAAALRQQVREGRLDGEAVSAILEAAGHRVPPVRRELVAGLTRRELDVLRLVARGQTLKEMGRSLGIAPKTADNHIQNLYAKIGVRTRAGATLFAVERGLTEVGAADAE